MGRWRRRLGDYWGSELSKWLIKLTQDEAGLHRNPDGEEIPCPHLHVCREGFGDKWAVAAPADRYTNTLDLYSTFEAFMQHCNTTDPPRIQRGLFS